LDSSVILDEYNLAKSYSVYGREMEALASVTNLMHRVSWPMLDALKARAARLKRELTALYYAYRDPRAPIAGKIVLIITLGYALSPIDLIPDFIPVLGYLDDLLILPALIALSIRLIPPELLEAAREHADREPIKFKSNWVAALAFAAIWIAVVVAVVRTIL